MNLLTLADSMDSEDVCNAVIRVDATPMSDRPVIVLKTEEVYLRLDLPRTDTNNMIDLLRGKVSHVKTLIDGCRVRVEEGSVVFTPSEQSGKPECSLSLQQLEVQKLIRVLEGWYNVTLEHPMVKHLYGYNTIKCESYRELNDALQILKAEGLRFRDGMELDASKYKEDGISKENPIYLSRNQNTAYTDSPRASDFVCCDFKLYGEIGEVLSPGQICNTPQ